MSARIFDESVWEKPADFTMQLDIPETAYNVLNADGTRPVVSLKIEGTSILLAVQVLHQLHDEESFLEIIAQYLTDGHYAEMMQTDEGKNVLADKMSEIHNDFFTVEFDADFSETEKVSLTVTAPSGVIAFRALQAMTKDDKLDALMVSFMPKETDDDVDDYYL